MQRIGKDMKTGNCTVSLDDENMNITLQDGVLGSVTNGEHGDLELIEYNGTLPDNFDATDNSIVFVAATMCF